ncbi:uncharacterized protein WM294_000025 [Sarcoramphus papa]
MMPVLIQKSLTETNAEAWSSSSYIHVSSFPASAPMLRPAEPCCGARGSHPSCPRKGESSVSEAEGRVLPAHLPPPWERSPPSGYGAVCLCAASEPGDAATRAFDPDVEEKQQKEKLVFPNTGFKQQSLRLTGSMSFSSRLRLRTVEEHERIPVQLRWGFMCIRERSKANPRSQQLCFGDRHS